MVRVDEDGTLDLAVGSQTTVTVELTGPMEFVRPLGRRGSARTLRFHADEPRAAVAALAAPRRAAPPEQTPEGAAPAPAPRIEAPSRSLTPERTAPSSPPAPPA